MTVSSTTARVSASGNGTTVIFPYSQYFLDQGDLVVVLRTSAGVETVQTITTHYTVTGAGDSNGGSVTMVTAPASGESLIIYNDPDATQTLNLVENDSLPAESTETALDRNTLLVQRVKDRLDRAITLSEGYVASFDLTLPTTFTADAALAVNSSADGFVMGPTTTDISNASTYATNASTAATNASTAETNASTAETNASTAETNASASAASAAVIVGAAQWSDVVYITNTDSPVAIVDADAGKLYVVDTSSGAVTFNLPAISALTLTGPWSIGIKKSEASTNAITVNRNGTDTIEGATSLAWSTEDAGYTFVPDTDGTPDDWTTKQWGAPLIKTTTQQSATYTAVVSDKHIEATANSFTTTLYPVANNDGRELFVSNTGTGVHTVDANSSETFNDGATTKYLSQDQGMKLRCNGGVWVVESFMPLTGYLKDIKTAGTDGGTFTSGAWQTRDLNNASVDFTKFGSLSSNAFTLEAGTYEIEARATAFRVDTHILKLRNTSDSSDVVIGTTAYSVSADGSNIAALYYTFTITASKIFEIQHRCKTTKSSNGFGLDDTSSIGVSNVYTEVKLKKIV